MRLLERMGDAGPPAPLLAVALGLLLPPLAFLGHALLTPCVVLVLAASVLLAEPGRLRLGELGPAAALALANLLVTPALVHGIAWLLGLDDIGGWLVLVAACPMAGSAAMIAGLLGLAVRPIVLGQMLCFFALPLTAPLVAGLVLQGATVDPWDLLERIGFTVGLPTLLGLGLRRAMGEAWRHRQRDAIRGAGLLGLSGIGLAVAFGLTHGLSSTGAWSAGLLGLGLVSAVGAAVGLVAGLLGGRATAAGFALCGAVRNVSLMWSATSGVASPEAELLMQLTIGWTFVLPLLLGVRAWVPGIWVRGWRLGGALLALLTMR